MKKSETAISQRQESIMTNSEMPEAIYAAWCINTDSSIMTWWDKDADRIKGEKTKYVRSDLVPSPAPVTAEEAWAARNDLTHVVWDGCKDGQKTWNTIIRALSHFAKPEGV